MAEAFNDPNWVDGEQTAGPPSSNAAEAPIVLDDTEGDSEETLSDIEEVAEPSLAGQVTGLRKKRQATSTPLALMQIFIPTSTDVLLSLNRFRWIK